MNLNPLKKDDNTDALVKALEDANNASGVPGGTPANAQQNTATPAPVANTAATVDSSIIASDPQIVGDQSAQSAVSPEKASVAPEKEVVSPAADASGITFDGNDLPAGMSSDANAHIDDPTKAGAANPELDGVKKSALEQLRPLIEKLDLEPADKFDKYLMMLRASDDPALIKPAFDAAQGITGEKQKAQALLDIINEINYITANQQ